MNLAELGAQLGLEEDEYRELLELFIEAGSADLSRLQAALGEKDADQVMRCAHTIKGASGNMGLQEVFETAKIIEKNAGNHHLEDLSAIVEKLRFQIDALRELRDA